MSIFCSKNLKLPPRLSDLFKTGRETQGWDIRNVYSRTHIPPKYVSALETGEFEVLPKAKAHRIAYVKEYAIALGLDPEKCLEQFSKEEGLKNITLTTTPASKRIFFGSLSILFRNLIIGSFIAGFAVFLVFQIKNILQAPELSIFNPTDGLITSNKSLLIEGNTDKGTTLTLNGQIVPLDNHNHFSVSLDLAEGLNTLDLTATKKHGKITEKVINVIMKPNAMVRAGGER